MSVALQSMPDRPHSVPRVCSFDAELTERISQLQQQEGRALAEEHLHVPTTHPQLSKLLQNCRKDENFYPFAVQSPAPHRAIPAASPLPFWKSSLHVYPCPSPAALAISVDSTTAYEVEVEGQMDGEFNCEDTEAAGKNVLDGHDIIGMNVQQLNELTQRVQQIAAWNDLTANLSFAQLQTVTPPSTPTPTLHDSSTVPSYQQSQDEAKPPRQPSGEEEQQEEDDYEVNEKLRAATPTVLTSAENSVNTSSSASNPVSPASSFVTLSSTTSSPAASSSFSQPFSSMFDRCADVSSQLHRSLQEFDSCIPLLLEEFQKRQFESAIYQKRNEETIAALEKEVDRLKAENTKLLEQQKEKVNKSVVEA